jgi:hypothetical protein
MAFSENHRRRVTLRRRQQQAAALGTSEQAAQERARMQREINRQLRTWSPRRIIAWSIIAFAGLMAANHIVAHVGESWLPMSLGWQDLLVGYPMAAVVALVGFIILGQMPGGASKSR